MSNQNKPAVDSAVKLVLQELKENPFYKFNLAFSLMRVIPFLLFFYLLGSQLSSLNVLEGHVGLVLSLTLFIAACGFIVGYGVLRSILNRVIYYAAQAKHSDQLKSVFVATVSHELKNPLTIIKTGISNIKNGLAGQINQTQEDILSTCQRIVERINRLINDLLDLHKIEAGMMDIKRKLCNLEEILKKQIDEFESMLTQKRIKLHKEGPDKDLSLWGDEDRLMQVVNNLLSNAIKYTPDDGNIDLTIYPCDGLVRIELVNTGNIIPQEKLAKIFDKFNRLDYSKEGTGLGLAIIKDIVELHKGKIWAESNPGTGNKFVVVLPCDLRKASR